MWRITLGLLLLLIGVFLVHLSRRHFRERKAQASWGVPAVGLCAFALLWTIGHAVLLTTGLVRGYSLAGAYKSGRCRVTEGHVQVVHEQSKHGHEEGDIIRVAGEVFEIDYFGGSGGYKRTIAYGGPLRDGAYVRIHHYEGRILRLDVRKTGPEHRIPPSPTSAEATTSRPARLAYYEDRASDTDGTEDTLAILTRESSAGLGLFESTALTRTAGRVLSDAQIFAALAYIAEHPDHSAWHVLMAIRRDAPDKYALIPGSTRAQTLCAGLAKVTYGNDWGVYAITYASDGPAALALIETGATAIPFLLELLGNTERIPLLGSTATFDEVCQYRRCDFAYRYIEAILGRTSSFPMATEERDARILALKTWLRDRDSGAQIPARRDRQIGSHVRKSGGKSGDASSLSDFAKSDRCKSLSVKDVSVLFGSPAPKSQRLAQKAVTDSGQSKSDRLLTPFLPFSGFLAESSGFVVHLGGRDVYVLREGGRRS